MHSQKILHLSLFIALAISQQAECAASKPLSTVFVLETSDLSTGSGASESQPDYAPAAHSDTAANTRIITDDGGPSKYDLDTSATSHAPNHNTNNNHHDPNQHNHPNNRNHSDPHKPKQQHSDNLNSHAHDANHQQHHTHSNSSGSNHNQDQNHHQNHQSNHQAITNSVHKHSSDHGNHGQQHGNQTHHNGSTSHHTSAKPHQVSHTADHHAPGSSAPHHVISKHDTSQAHNATDHKHSTGNQVATSRRLDDEAQVNANHKAAASTSNQSGGHADNHKGNQHHQDHHKQQTRSSTPTPAHDEASTTPKSEERLLISISSGEDEDYKPPKSLGSGLSVENDDVSSQSHQQHHHHKRKPSITISIQDANLKQNGGSGPSAVIVRPSENGQSIVISTVGAGGIETKPTVIGTAGANGSGKPSIAIISNDRDPPYREPINPPSHTGTSHGASQHASTTHRPAVITSTLIEPLPPSRPQSQVTDERPVISRPSTPPAISAGSGEGAEPISSASGEHHDNKNSETKYPLNERNCGLVHETRIVGGDEANPDDFMWMAAIIKSRPKDGEAKPFCGGSLITRRHVLTAAHCLENLAPRDVLVRLGSYDFDDSTASSLSADYAIDQFRVPGQYSKKTHVADIAIMRLKTPLALTDNYKTVCMPQSRRSYVGALGTVTGYGSQSTSFRHAAPKLRQVTVPIWENRKCSAVYKKNLTESFLCAGYEEGGKDACQGDSGGPLMTEGPNERMMIVGVVSHGIGCGGNYPGVYTRTTTFLDWIEKNTKE